jgi:hypothetical protein
MEPIYRRIAETFAPMAERLSAQLAEAIAPMAELIQSDWAARMADVEPARRQRVSFRRRRHYRARAGLGRAVDRDGFTLPGHPVFAITHSAGSATTGWRIQLAASCRRACFPAGPSTGLLFQSSARNECAELDRRYSRPLLISMRASYPGTCADRGDVPHYLSFCTSTASLFDRSSTSPVRQCCTPTPAAITVYSPAGD